ncbi:MAG: tRNA (N6-isopentenyl adenosine(37)-C2)-methylthiotransferase MiaB [Candidatus Hydrogenedentota bacterium]|nr:MAG: tRNA (N6-isopentenyl adenosine(37)-C2)-methylthiotransferase MiaB [Candidatus Hydrogenedentota bacterium]
MKKDDRDFRGRAHIATFGCQMNHQESAVMAELLARAGYSLVNDPLEADLLVLETCAIRQKAEDKVFSLLGRYRKWRREGKNLRIVVCGCLVTEEGARDLVTRYGIDAVLGPRRIALLPDAVRRCEEEPVIEIGEEWVIPPDDVAAPYIPGLSAYVTVMQGCSNRCSFCVVPSRRGAATSRPIEAIVGEVRRLEAAGYREVTLLGQNISYYGRDGSVGGARLIDLLEAVDRQTTMPRIRFATSHPAYIDHRFLRGFTSLERVMPHLHLPVQSGSDRILKAMRRGYSARRFLEIVEEIRSARPDIAVTTDFITGFDGETEADFRDTVELARKAELDGAYVFAYSERPGTEAVRAGLGDPVPVEIRKERCRELLAIVEEGARNRRQRERGTITEVLVEEPGRGRNRQNIPVFFEGGVPKRICPVFVEEVTPFALKGRLCFEEGAGGGERAAERGPEMKTAAVS